MHVACRSVCNPFHAHTQSPAQCETTNEHVIQIKFINTIMPCMNFTIHSIHRTTPKRVSKCSETNYDFLIGSNRCNSGSNIGIVAMYSIVFIRFSSRRQRNQILLFNCVRHAFTSYPLVSMCHHLYSKRADATIRRELK